MTTNKKEGGEKATLNDVEAAIWSLLSDDKFKAKRFYGYLIQSMKRIYTDKVPTAGVSVTDQVNLYINLEFFKTLTVKQRVQVFEHECKHVIHNHAGRFKDLGDFQPQMWNLACDAAINEELDSLHEMGVTVERLREQFKQPKIQKNQSAEYYYKIIKQWAKDNPDKVEKTYGPGGELSTVDDHEKWKEQQEGEDNGEGELSGELSKEIIKKSMKEAVEKSGGVGNCPHEIAEAMEQMNKSSVTWKQHLRKFVSKADNYLKETTRKRRNRRYGILYAGKKKKPNLHLAIALDESGSVGDDEFIQFFAELDRLVDFGVTLTIIHADATVNNVYEYEKKMKITRSGCGGTCYIPAIDYAATMNIDGLIYFGDGEVWEKAPPKPKFPVLWAIVRNDTPPFKEFGTFCKVEVVKK